MFGFLKKNSFQGFEIVSMVTTKVEACPICGEPSELCNCEHKDWNQYKQEEIKLGK